MTEHDAFETSLRAALLRHVADGPTEFDALAFARTVAAKEPRRPRLASALPWRGPAMPRLAWLLLVAALLAALAGTAVVASRLLETLPQPLRHSTALVPTGVDVLTPEPGIYVRLAADGNGILWACEGDGRLLRYDPPTGSGRTWTVSNDAAFAASEIIPSKAGGVWLVKGKTLRWFDGTIFRDVIDAPVDITVATEAPDGSLWVATWDGVVLHRDGSEWTGLDLARPDGDASVSAIAVDETGHPWIGWALYSGSEGDPGSGWVSRYDGSRWTTFDAKDAAPFGGTVSAIVQSPDRAVWVATSAGLARFDGSAWTDVTAQPWGTHLRSVVAGPGGEIWVTAQDPTDFAVTVGRFDGRSWVTYEPAGGDLTWVAATQDGVYGASWQGLFRLSGEAWTRTWPPAPWPMWMEFWPMVAVSRDELWAHSAPGLWHFQDGAWTREMVGQRYPNGVVNAMALAPDGTVWAAGDEGVAYRRDGRWTVVDTQIASAIAVDRGGTVWAWGIAPAWAGTLCNVWTLRFVGTVWVRADVPGCPYLDGVRQAAVDASGGVWAGAAPLLGGYGDLAHFDGHSWQLVASLGGVTVGQARLLGTTPDGDLWIAAQDASTDGNPMRLARFNGKDWTVTQLPFDPNWNVVLAPDGTLWASGSSRGLAHFDGQRLTFPYPIAFSENETVSAVARDGTVFGTLASSVLRFPAQAPSP
jgi:ligand-binding sensor domain-containing protein